MKHKRICEQCGKTFTSDREDARFCEPKCTARWYRQNYTHEAAFHAAKERFYVYTCEQCFEEFWINDYGKREGKRKPRFCSTACRVKNHRAVHAAMGGQEGWKDANTNRKSQGTGSRSKAQQDQAKQDAENKQREDARKQREEDDRQRKQRSKAHTQSSKSAWEILGVVNFASYAACRKAYMELIKIWHPDRNNDPTATARTQEINGAFDYVKAYYGK